MIKERKKQYSANGTFIKSRVRFNSNNPCDVDVTFTILSMMEVKCLLSATLAGKTLQ